MNHPQSSRSDVARWRFPVLLLGMSLLINIAAALLFRAHGSIGKLEGDEREYWDIATQLRAHGLAAIPARRTLPYPLLIATLRAVVGDDYLRVQLVLSALLSLSPVLMYLLVRRRIANEKVARVASVAFLLWPPLVKYGASIYSDSTGLMLFLAYLWAFPLPAIAAPASWRRWAQFTLAGALLGVCVQAKPQYLVYFPFAFCLALLCESAMLRRVAAVACLFAGCAVVMAPWSTYISAREGRFLLVSANDGETLAGGLNPVLLTPQGSDVVVTAEGRETWVGPGKWLTRDKTGYLSAQELSLPYSQTSVLLSQRTRAWVLANPGAAAYLSVRKLLYMWGLYPFWNGASQTLLGNLPLLLLVAVAAIGLWVNRRSTEQLALFWTLPFFSSLIGLVSWGSWRFRVPADAGLIVLAAMLAVSWPPRPVPIVGRGAKSDGQATR